ncbi:kinase-like domain-containing protein [Mycena epipterygia]|nr:kinase-like domain-containing protein [Mycena epipterygia]
MENPREDKDFNLIADSEYSNSIYKNLINVLWTEAKTQNNLRIQEDITQCATLTIVSKEPSPDISALGSALKSQRDLLEIALTLSLAEDAKTRDALYEDRKNIKACLISTQKAILERTEDAHSILDLVQDVLDNSGEENRTDTRLHRLIVNLCFSCGQLPSSLSIQGIEQRGPHPVASGGFGDIYKAMYRSKHVALKQLRFYENHTVEDEQKIRQKFCQEALLWKNLNHPSVLPFIGLHSSESVSTRTTLSMVCPWMPNGTIVKYLKETPTTHAHVFLLQIAQGLHYLHSQHVVHGDLRGENILVDDEGHARLADFGLASYADATAKSSARAGSTRWMAPELLDPGCLQIEHFKRTFASDSYAFACVCYELYTGKYPFAEIQHDTAVMFDVIKGKRPRRVPTAIPVQTWSIVRASWCQNPSERLTAAVIVEKLEIVQKDLIERTGDGNRSPTEPSEVYKPPRSLGISQNAGSTASLTRTPSLMVNVEPPKGANGWRRNSGFDFSTVPSHTLVADHSQMNWRQGGRRAISMFSGLIRKAKSGDTATTTGQTDPGTSHAFREPKRRFLSLLPR